MSATRPLEDFSIIGDMRTLAVVGVGGSIDWLCWPRFDSPSIFGALLDSDGGRWTTEPCDVDALTRQVYLSGTNVLVTRFHTSSGVVEVEDFMTLGDAGQHVVRSVRCLRGSVGMRSEVDVRPDYGRAEATISRGDDVAGGIALAFGAGNDAPQELHVSGTVEWAIDDALAVCSFSLQEGDVDYLVLGDGRLDRAECTALHRSTTEFWRAWTEETRYDGRWRESVERSALVLKLLTHEPSGGIIAAGTTSLPEVIGGERNWDYRYVWIRDAAFTIYAFIKLGHLAEADAVADWLVAVLLILLGAWTLVQLANPAPNLPQRPNKRSRQSEPAQFRCAVGTDDDTSSEDY